ncbi:MAG: hypothetical protein AABY49_13450 [Planctomycetota bacterium]
MIGFIVKEQLPGHKLALTVNGNWSISSGIIYPSFRKDSSANHWNPCESGVGTLVKQHDIPFDIELLS